MTVEEIFSLLAAHMEKGIRMHNHLVTAFGFLNLCGYQKCQEYHFFEEGYNYRKFLNFYLDNYNKMIIKSPIEEINVIPSNWYKHLKKEVDTSTKRTAIRDLMEIWVDWETETKKLLENEYKELYDLGEINGAIKIMELIQDVSKELEIAHKKQINLETIGYDISLIVDEQEKLYKKYQSKIKNIYEDDE